MTFLFYSNVVDNADKANQGKILITSSIRLCKKNKDDLIKVLLSMTLRTIHYVSITFSLKNMKPAKLNLPLPTLSMYNAFIFNNISKWLLSNTFLCKFSLIFGY